MPLKEGILFLFFIFITSSAGTIISVSYIIKCWTFKLGDEIKRTREESLAKCFHKAVSPLLSLHDRGSGTWKNRLYHKDHTVSPGSQNTVLHLYNHLRNTHRHENVGCPPHHPICGKIELIKFQLKNISFVYFLGGAKIH